MKNRLGLVGLLALGTILEMAACSSDDDSGFTPPPATAGSGGSGGASAGNGAGGSSAGKAGGTQGGTGGTAGAGTAGGGNGGNAGMNEGPGGAGSGGEPGMGGEANLGGMPGLGGAGGESALGGAGGEGGGSVVEPVACDYTEVENGNTVMNTALSTTAAAKVLCGKIDVGDYTANTKVLDLDRYNIGVTTGNVIVKVELPSLAGLTKVEVQIDNEIRVVTQLVSVFTIPAQFDSVFFRVVGYSDADLPQAIPYQVSLVSGDVDSHCPAAQGAAAYTEANDGNDSRGNDVYTVNNEVAALTAANDAAEATGITVGKSSYLIKGVGGDTPRVDDYWDSDSYTFHTGPGVTQVTLRADWTGSKDVDLWVFPVGSTTPVGNGLAGGSLENVTVRVQPNTDYIAYAAYSYASTKPFNYSLTLCGETYSLK